MQNNLIHRLLFSLSILVFAWAMTFYVSALPPVVEGAPSNSPVLATDQ